MDDWKSVCPSALSLIVTGCLRPQPSQLRACWHAPLLVPLLGFESPKAIFGIKTGRTEGDDIASAAVIAFAIFHSANSGRSVKLRRESFLTYSKRFRHSTGNKRREKLCSMSGVHFQSGRKPHDPQNCQHDSHSDRSSLQSGLCTPSTSRALADLSETSAKSRGISSVSS